MCKKLTLKTVVLMALMVALSGYAHAQTAGNPPMNPGTERLQGPAIVGTATFSDVTGKITFTGACKGQQISFVADLITFSITDVSQVTLELLENFRPVSTDEVPQCYAGVAGQVVVNTVISFANDGDVAIAQVVLLAVVPR